MIESKTTRKFWQLFKDLPSDVQSDAKQAFVLFCNNPWHPGLRFKRIAGDDSIYSARVGLGHRGLCVMNKNRVVWFGIGSHEEYDRLI